MKPWMRSGGPGSTTFVIVHDLKLFTPPFMQFSQLQRYVHFTPVKKHSQYFLQQLVFLQLQPFFKASSDPSPMSYSLFVKALGSFSITACLAFFLLSSNSPLFLHWQQEHFSLQRRSLEKHSQYIRRHLDLGHLQLTSVTFCAEGSGSMLIF